MSRSKRERKRLRREQKRRQTLQPMKPKLIVPDYIWEQIMYWTDKSNNEVSGFGNLEWDSETNTFTVEDVILVDQTVHGSETEMDANALGKAEYDLKRSAVMTEDPSLVDERDIKRAMFEMEPDYGLMKWHWHSHVNMACNPSGPDMELYRQLGHKGWILASIVNKKRDHKTFFCTVVEFMGQVREIFERDIDTIIKKYHDADLIALWDKEYEAKVHEKVWHTVHPIGEDYYNRTYGPYGRDSAYEGQFDRGMYFPDKPLPNQGQYLASLKDDNPEAEIPQLRDYPVDMLYDQWGMKMKENGEVLYNPLYNEDIKLIGDVNDEIWEMDQGDRRYLLQTDKYFADYWNWLITRGEKVDERILNKATGHYPT